MCPDTVSGADLSSVVQKSTMAALREVIFEIEARKLPHDEEAKVIEQATVTVTKAHVTQALSEIREK